MAIQLIAEDGNERQHREWLQQLLNTSNGPVRIASAYVTDDDLLLRSKDRTVQLFTYLNKLDVASGATKISCLQSLIKSGVKCHCLSSGPRLHAKTYIFGDKSAVVTSANLTTNGLDSNIEVGVHITGPNVQELIDWFDAFWKKADSLDLSDLSKWEKETAALRRAYADLRRKARAMPRLPKEAMPSVRSPPRLRDLTENARSFFVCNTNRRHSPDKKDENLMRRTKYAITWTQFKHPEHMKRVRRGDMIFMFAKGVGIIGIGRAKGRNEVLLPGHPARITADYARDEEWRVPVEDWLVWVDNDEEACPWKMPNASFLDVSKDVYRDMREKVRAHFLSES
jgi:hypothetical protein